jgi:single-stranded DNA-binding protein
LFKGTVLGFLPKDAAVEISGKGEPYMKFSVGVPKGQSTEFIDVVVTNEKLLDRYNEGIRKGTNVVVAGDESVGTYTRRSGETAAQVTIFADSLQKLPPFARREDQ